MSAQPADPTPEPAPAGPAASSGRPGGTLFGGRLTRRGALTLAPAAALAAACTSTKKNNTSGTGTSSAKNKTLDAVTYTTGFGVFGREGYAWVAQAKGFFAESGLDVKILPGAAGDANLAALRADRTQFAVLDYSTAVVRSGKGTLDDVRCIAAVNPRTLIALMALPGHGITRAPDLAGKSIAQAPGAIPRVLFPVYAKLAGFDATHVTWRELAPPQLPGVLASGKVDAIGQFVVGAPAVKAAAKGVDPVVLPYSDYLTDLYGNVIVTTTRMIKDKPDLVRRFVRGIMGGLRYAVDHAEESGQILHTAVPATPAKVAGDELTLMRSYVAPDAADHLGLFDPGRVARGIAVLQSNGMFPNGFQPSQVVDFSFVNKA
jgi:NitT/TauT family transport system substrate-binding protein